MDMDAYIERPTSNKKRRRMITHAKDRQDNLWQNNAETMGFIIKNLSSMRIAGPSMFDVHLRLCMKHILLFCRPLFFSS